MMMKLLLIVIYLALNNDGVHAFIPLNFKHTHMVSLHAVTPEFQEVCETTGVTLTRFMHEVERCNPELEELAQLFSGIQTASKAITNLVKRSQLPSSSVLGLEGNINVQGEDQKVS